MNDIWKIAFSLCGIGGIGAFTFYSLYKNWLKIGIFSKLTKTQTFICMLVFLFCTFISFVLMIFSYNKTSSTNVNSKDNKDVYMQKNTPKGVLSEKKFIIKCGLASYKEEEVRELKGYLDYDSSGCDFQYIEKNNKIAPHLEYIDQFFTEKFLNIPIKLQYLPSFDIHYPTLDVKIINNSDDTIVIDNIVIDVESSEIDEKPFVFFCTEHEYFKMVNEGYKEWKLCNINFNLNSTPSQKNNFNKKSYKYNLSIPYFKEIYKIDMSPYILKEGVDIDFLKKQMENGVLPNETNINEFSKAFGKFEYKNKFGEHYIFIDGDIQIIDINNNINTMHFTGEIYLYSTFTGGDLQIFDSYDLKLENEGEDYKKLFPISMSLEPKEAERFLLTLAADKTSSHKFSISLDNINEINLNSEMKFLNIFVPRTSYEVFANKDEYTN